MVASERMARAQAEERERVTVENLAAAEAAIKDMQAHLQSLEGAASAGAGPVHQPLPRRYLSSHPPYAEFLSLLSHLRALRPRTQRARELYAAPLVPNLLAQPFLARAIAEDHEPTLRLDAAPELSWLSRRNVGSAIIAGELLIEPAPAASFGPLDSINCAMCGTGVFSRSAQPTSRFSLKPFFGSSSTGSAHSPTSAQVYAFRTTEADAKAYPLCKNGWCLERLRSACALWHFVRTGIVAPVWAGEDGTDESSVSLHPPSPSPAHTQTSHHQQTITVTADDLLGEHPRIGRSVSQPAPAKPANTPPATEKKSGWGIGGFKMGWSSRPQTPSAPSVSSEVRKEDDSDGATMRTANSAVQTPTDADSTRAIYEGKTAREATAEQAAEAASGVDTTVKAEAEEPETKSELRAKDQEGQPASESARRPRSPSLATTDSEYSFTTPPNEPKEPKETNPSSPADAAEVADALVKVNLEAEPKPEAAEGEATETNTPAEAAEAAEPTSEADTKPEATDADAETKPEATEESKTEGSPPPRPERKRAAPPPPLPKRSERRAAGSNASTPTAGHFPGTPTAPGPPSGPGSATPPSVSSAPGTPAEPTAAPAAQTEAEVKEPEAEQAEAEHAGAKHAEVKEAEVKAGEPAEEPTEEPAEEKAECKAESKEPTEPTAPLTPTTPKLPPPPRHFAVTSAHPGATATAAAEAATSPRSPRSAAFASNERNERRASAALSPSTSPRASTSLSRSNSTTAPSAPSLPPRVNVRHASNPASTGGAGKEESGPREKTFLVGEEWEVRCWKQIIRLKEDMWRARVGVVDDQ